MELRRVAPGGLDTSLGRLRQLPDEAVRAKESSLRAKGQLTPLVAAECEGALVLIDGFVRHLAALRLGLDEVLVEVVQLSPLQMKAQVYLRNRERGLLLIEECRLVRELCDVDGLSQVEIGDLLERHKSWVCRRVALSHQVSPRLLEELSLGQLGPGCMRRLAQLPARNQEELWAVARREGLSSRDTSELVELWRRAPDPEARRYVLEHPRDALRRARVLPELPADPRLTRAGREVLRGLSILRRVSLRLVGRLSEGLGELSTDGVALLSEARKGAEGDCTAALAQVAAFIHKEQQGARK